MRFCSHSLCILSSGFRCGFGCGLAPFSGTNLCPMYRCRIRAETLSISEKSPFFFLHHRFSNPRWKNLCNINYSTDSSWSSHGFQCGMHGFQCGMHVEIHVKFCCVNGALGCSFCCQNKKLLQDPIVVGRYMLHDESNTITVASVINKSHNVKIA